MHFPQTTKVLTQANAERTVELLCGKLLLQRRPRVSQCELRSPSAREILSLPDYRRRVRENNYIFEYPWNLVKRQNATRVSLKNQPVKK